MKIFPGDRWVRAFVEGTTVVDSRDSLLFWEDGFPVPGYAFSAETAELPLLSEGADAPVRRATANAAVDGQRAASTFRVGLAESRRTLVRSQPVHLST
ncbi:hypothetical protein [Cryobacterium sp. HLT2-28]|uniref:hypothetical protein n=1 Tax=Cryobacterium sp. HLT2-28 TaxID=1259146 RepID=UPI00106DCC41|nr:hypothetical protein [Cryobacterium sp. HLT2-28]TFB99005.1 hypothetical protein E3O48_00740 [Cryobacterium sp. HLT2-28]